jgi:hypothetical protein
MGKATAYTFKLVYQPAFICFDIVSRLIPMIGSELQLMQVLRIVTDISTTES